MSGLEYLDDLISWVPTTGFILIILGAMFSGFMRGYRKSMIFLIHSLIAACICVVLYFILKDNTKVDELILKVVNFFMGSGTALQDKLNVSAKCTSIKEILLEYIPENMNFVDGLSLILKDNGAYILTLIDLAYSIIFALVLYLLYLILIGIMALMYHLFYSDRKYRKKDTKLIMKRKREHRYSRRRTLGTVIGAFRGFVGAFIYISFIGTIFFVAAGGTGTEKNEEFDFGNDEINNIYNAYNSICNYGNEGIFRILNTFKDNDNNPYYLFVADVVLSGELKVNDAYTNNVIFREELATYVDFSRKTFNLVLKYGGDEIKQLINGEAETNEILDKLIPIMIKEDFQKEFEILIENFDAKVYFSGLTLSLIDSIVSNIDELEFTSNLDGQIKDLLCIIFKEGYLSESIPYEKALKIKLNAKTNEEKFDLGHISASDIINKDNMLCAYKILNFILSYSYDLGENATDEDMIKLIEQIIPYIDNLSIFYPENSQTLNKLYRRIYAFVQYNYLEEDKEDIAINQLSTKYYISEEYDSINWVTELNSIVSSASDLLYMYKAIEIDFEDPNAIIDLIFSIYNPTNSNYESFSVRMDNIISYLSTSRLLSEVLASNFIYSAIEKGLVTAFDDYQMPKLKYSNTYNEHGSLIEYGEVYYLLSAIRSLAKNTNNYDLIKYLMECEITEDNTIEVINTVCSSLTSEDNIQTIDLLLSSKLVRSILSTLLGTIKLDGNNLIYADKTILESEGSNPTNIIIKSELNDVIYLIPELLELLEPMLKGEFTNEQIAELLENETLLKLLDSTLIEGTISNIVVTYLKDVNQIVIPQSLLNKEGYISTSDKTSELRTVINIVKELNLDLAVLMDGNIESSVDDLLNNDNLGMIFDSKLLHYTLSYYITSSIDSLLTGFSVIIPDSTKDLLVNDTINSVIKKEAFLEFLDVARELIPKSGEEALTVNEIIKKVVVEKDKYLSNIIISATIINYLANDAGLDAYLSMPARFKTLASKEILTSRYDKNSIWYSELFKLCTGLDEFFNISNSDDFDLSNLDNINESVNSLLNNPAVPSNVDPNRIKLDVIYDSAVVAKTLTNELNKYLTDALIKPEVKYSKYVYDSVDGIYIQEEIVKLAHAISALGLSLESGFDNSVLSIPSDPLEKQKVYDSILVIGLITKMVDDVLDSTNGMVRRMDLAYNQDYIEEFKLYKQTEIDVIVELLGDDLNAIMTGEKKFDIANYKLTDFKNVMFDDNNEIKSYILTGTMSDTIINSGYFHIPKKDYDYSLEIISVESMISLIDSLVIADFNSLDVNLENFEFPPQDVVSEIAKSSILRATLSKKINITSDTSEIIVGVTHDLDINGNYLYFEETYDYLNERLSYLTEYEFTNLICAISELLGDEKAFEFDMNENLVKTLITLEDKTKRETILRSNVVRTALSKYINDGNILGLTFEVFETMLDIDILEVDIRDLKTENDIKSEVPTSQQYEEIFEYILRFI